ncbi:MAG: hypothetical protein E7506_01725 [Ruminococcus sp.]|nr:hypothetical protein [Ruminococcus sp.]
MFHSDKLYFFISELFFIYFLFFFFYFFCLFILTLLTFTLLCCCFFSELPCSFKSTYFIFPFSFFVITHYKTFP